jgi:hypothetical protein
VQIQKIKFSVFIVAVSLLLANSVYAFDMGNMMNPSKWMGGNKDKNQNSYDEYRDGPGYGYPGGPPGYGYGGAPGYGADSGYGGAPGYGAAPGYGGAPGYGAAPGYGGAPGYGAAPGYGGAPGYGAAPGYGGAPTYGAPVSGSNEAEIRRLKERIRQLEGGVR